LGIERPAPPQDPDAGTHSLSGARDLLSTVDRSLLDAEVRAHGFLTPAAVRSLIAENCTRGQLENGGLDPEFLLLIDARINYKLYIAGDSVYTREELYSNFPFYEFGVQPEAVFVAQEVGLFEMPQRAGAARVAAPTPPAAVHAAVHAAPDYDYAVRDVGDQRLEFSPAEDLVRAATSGIAPRQALRIIQTKIYVGREAWDDFTLQMRFYRGAIRMAAAGGTPLALTATPASPATSASAITATTASATTVETAVAAAATTASATTVEATATMASPAAAIAVALPKPAVDSSKNYNTDERVLELCSELALLKQRVAALETQRQFYV
jgi:hypothetical protein